MILRELKDWGKVRAKGRLRFLFLYGLLLPNALSVGTKIMARLTGPLVFQDYKVSPHSEGVGFWVWYIIINSIIGLALANSYWKRKEREYLNTEEYQA